MLRIDFVTIFPGMIEALIAEGVIARGIKAGLLDIRAHDLRAYATDKHRSTDDEAYGGGPGMVMLAEPVLRCVESLFAAVFSTVPDGGEDRVALETNEEVRISNDDSRTGFAHRQGESGVAASDAGGNHALGETPPGAVPLEANGEAPQSAEPVLHSSFEIRNPSFNPPSADGEHHQPPKPHLVMTTPTGRKFTQAVARELSQKPHLVFLCGRYEGFDQRVHDALQPDEISIGDFVVSGGELPAMLMADAACRMIAGVVGNRGSVEEDSFFNGLLDYPHYTRPLELRGMRVPDILMSGHHEKIRRWRKEQALRATRERRPDLLESAELDAEARKILVAIDREPGRGK